MNEQGARDLLLRATDDARAAQAAVSVLEITDAIVGFHAQQAVEKSMKAVLAFGGHAFPFSHDLKGSWSFAIEWALNRPRSLRSRRAS